MMITFYARAASYWAKMPATIDSMLGGYGEISRIDVEGSKEFLNDILSRDDAPGTKIALDCGAGIGRVSKDLLIPHFEKVDLVDQDEKFINTAKQLLEEDKRKVGTLYIIGLQHFQPDKKYDVIWCQWVLGQLKDSDMINFLKRCSDALTENGVIIIKDNISSSNEIEYHYDDSTVARPNQLMATIFQTAALKIIKQEVQKGFPADIYPVYTYALIPLKRKL